MMSSEAQSWHAFGWIILASALAHIWCVRSVFFMDDYIAITLNKRVIEGRFWESLLLTWTHLFYWIEYRLFGMSAPGFHAVNWLLHTSVACALFGFARDFLKNTSSAPTALFAALLFAVHPLASEIPNYARSQDLAWVTLFSLLACWMLLKFRENTRPLHLVACGLFMIGAALSKGPGLFHALLAVVTLALAFGMNQLWQMVKRYAWLVVLIVLISLVAFWASGTSQMFYHALGRWSEPRFIGHAYTLARVFWEFAWRAVIPVSLSADHHIAETLVPPGSHFWSIPDTGAIWSAVAMLAVAGFSVFLICRKSTKLVGVCLFLFVGTMLFRVFYLIPEFMPEYRIYPGLPWFCIGAAILLHSAIRRFSTIPPRVAAVILLGAFAILSARRSFVWHSLDSLAADILNQYPTQARTVWELHERDIAAGNWQAIIDRQRTVWPEVARRFHAENKRLAPARELPTGLFALAEVACAGDFARAIAKTQNPIAGLREIGKLEIYMHRLGLDPEAHRIHWGYLNFNKGVILEMAGKDEAALACLRQPGVPFQGQEALARVQAKVDAKATK